MRNIPETKPNPDPTVSTVDFVARSNRAERDYAEGKIETLRTRLDGRDEAVRVLSETVNRTPTLLQTAIGTLSQLTDEKFNAINDKLHTAEDLRLEQKQDSKIGLDAALASQKDAVSEQNKSNSLAINKSETATSENIKKLEELFTSKTQALSDKVDDLKTLLANTITKSEHQVVLTSITSLNDRLNIKDGQSAGGKDTALSVRTNLALAISVVLFILSVAGFIIAFAK